ncbi:MAG: PilZ domain-containing protein [Gammaproteobacteria bacterium]|nr:PilZ domain-containing protein [Gammaproteobacteria bacterium]
MSTTIANKMEHYRDYFRVEFPKTYYPVIHLEDGQYDVVDVSECGVRFKINNARQFREQDRLTAIIQFPDGDIFDCSGQIVRMDDHAVSMSLFSPLPLKKIRSEHLYLLNNYPTR